MTAKYTSHRSTGCFSKLMCDYIEGNSALRSFYQHDVSIDAFKSVIANKQFSKEQRNLLVERLKAQYATLSPSKIVWNNIELLSCENTYVITTAHQPVLFTGPLYAVFKAVSAIKLCLQLKNYYPEYHFVPMYWIGGEDHDFEEMQSAKIFNKRFTWESDEVGAVGRMSCEGIRALLPELKTVLGESDKAHAIYALFNEAYALDNFGDATRYIMDKLFDEHGLVSISGDDAALKASFSEVISDELETQMSQKTVAKTIDDLAELYHKQAHPREINLFYLNEAGRRRIEYNSDTRMYTVVDSDIQFTREEIMAEVANNPERFSPNVILRPVYQEFILPNLAYIGGGGELAYWLQYKSNFERLGVPYPMLILRDSAILVDKTSHKKLEKLELDVLDIFKDEAQLIADFVKENSGQELSLANELSEVNVIFKSIEHKANKIDGSLARAVIGEGKKMENALRNLESKLLRAEKKKFETVSTQISSLKENLLPGGGLQERVDNYFTIYMKDDKMSIQLLIDHFNSIRKEVLILC